MKLCAYLPAIQTVMLESILGGTKYDSVHKKTKLVLLRKGNKIVIDVFKMEFEMKQVIK